MNTENESIIHDLFNGERITGISSGFSGLDEITGGLKTGELILLAGSTGIGKTLLALTILVNVAKRGEDVLYLDLENGKHESIKRLLMNWFEKEPTYFKDKDNEKEATGLLAEIEERIDYWSLEDLLPFKYSEDPGKAIVDVINIGGRSRERKPRVVIVDPLQSLETEIDPGKTYNQQGKIICDLRNLAQKKNIAIIICHHLRKSLSARGDYVTDLDDIQKNVYRIPSVEDIKGSGKITDFPQQVWGMVRTNLAEQKEIRQKTLLRVLKNRSGRTGDIKLFFNEDYLKFQDKPVQYEPDLSFFNSSLV